MYNPQAVYNLGRLGVFFGVDDNNQLTLEQWQNRADWCVSHKLSFVIVKVFDAGWDWYPGSAFTAIHQIFQAKGLGVMPYGFLGTAQGYAYDLARDIPAALPIIKKYMADYGMCCIDIEGDGWANHPEYGSQIKNSLWNAPGVLTASCPANPVDASMVGSFAALYNVVSMWMPMAYNDYLSAVYVPQLEAVGSPTMPVAPTFDLSNEFGPNDVLANAKSALKYKQMSFWFLDFAQANTGLFDTIVATVGANNVLPSPPPPAPPPEIVPNAFMQKSALAEWNSLVPGIPTTGAIAEQWFDDFYKGIFHGAPNHVLEEKQNDWNGIIIEVLRCNAGRFENDGTTVRWYRYS